MKVKLLIVVDMQNDFIRGALGTREALKSVSFIVDKIRNHNGIIVVTKDTHGKDYLHTQEGKNLPVEHCIKDTFGWELDTDVQDALQGKNNVYSVEKGTFGSLTLIDIVKDVEANGYEIESAEFVGLCTDICVVSNALILKSALPEVPFTVYSDGCAGVTPETHEAALKTMEMCQIKVV